MRLIENINDAWRFASVRLAMLAGVIAGWAAYDPAGFAQLVELLPEPARPLVGIAVFAVSAGSRVVKFDKAG